MTITVPRALISGIAAAFAFYLSVLGIYALDRPYQVAPVIAALVIFLLATVVSLAPVGPSRMPIWMAALNDGVVVVISLLVSANLHPDPPGGNGYATWYVGAAGALLAITATRRRYGFAWAGTAFLVLHTVAWAGPAELVSAGVVGSVSWVAAAHIITASMARASKDAQRFAIAEREATDWQALQEAHVHERQFRLGQTSSMALDMLHQIEDSGGLLTEDQRQECLYLEGAIRDEIRGRQLLSHDVRAEVMAARRRGATVTLLDEGGLDDLAESEASRVHAALASAIAGTDAQRIIVRTVAGDPTVAVTVVGLRGTAADDDDDGDEEIDLWLEIPREAIPREAG